MKKKLVALASVACAAVLGLGAVGCGGGGAAETEENSYIALDINPSIELIVDKHEKVVSVRGTNEDGQVLLYGEVDGLVGKSVDEALNFITDEAVELGYLSEDNKVVQFNVSSSQGEKVVEALSKKVNTRVTATAEGLGLSVTTDAEGAYSLLRRFEEFKAAHPSDTAIQNLDVASFRLALSASETGDITLEAAVKLDDEELIKMLTAETKEIEEYATAAYAEAKVQASAVYDKLAGAALDGIYAAYYTSHALSHVSTAYYGVAYQMYATTACGVGVVADSVSLLHKISNKPLTEAQVKAIVTALNLTPEQAEALKDGNGNVTIASVEAYANKLFKNSELSAELEAKKQALTQALNTAESALKEEAERLSQEYSDEIAAISTAADSLVQAAESLTTLLPEAVKGFVTEMKTAAADLKENFKGGVSLEKLYEMKKLFADKADKMLTLIKEDLSEDELEEVEQLRSEAAQTLASAKQTLENALNTAETEARAKLAELKANRTAAAN